MGLGGGGGGGEQDVSMQDDTCSSVHKRAWPLASQGSMCFTRPGHIAMVTLGEGWIRGEGLDGGMRVQKGKCKEDDWDWDELLVLH